MVIALIMSLKISVYQIQINIKKNEKSFFVCVDIHLLSFYYMDDCIYILYGFCQ